METNIISNEQMIRSISMIIPRKTKDLEDNGTKIKDTFNEMFKKVFATKP